MYLLTNPLTNIAGVYKITYRRIAFDTGLSQLEIADILKEFQAAGKAAFVDEYIILPNWPKYQRTTSKDTKAGIDRVLSELPENVLLSLKEINYRYDAVPIPSPKAPIRPPIGPLPSARPTSTLNSYSSPIPKLSSMQEEPKPDDHVDDGFGPLPAAASILTDQVKNAVQLAPFQIRLSTQDLEDITVRLNTEDLGTAFIAYVIRRAEADAKKPGAFARSALLGEGAFATMPEEYRDQKPPTPKSPERDPPPELCDDCGIALGKYSDDEYGCKACGSIWAYDKAFGFWAKSPDKLNLSVFKDAAEALRKREVG
jgi:hypothetical protein